MRWSALVVPLMCLACERSISLGSECPATQGPCPSEDEGAGDPRQTATSDSSARETGRDAGAALDAAVLREKDAGKSADNEVDGDISAAPPIDASAVGRDSAPAAMDDGGTLRFPDFSNPSFELMGDAGTAGPLQVTAPSSIDPWYSCRPGMAVVSEFQLDAGVQVHPTGGNTFFADTFPNSTVNVGGLVQELKEPLRAGQRYAFGVDLWSETGALQPIVELQVAAPLLPGAQRFSCILSSFVILGSSGPIEPGGWRSKCISFTPLVDAPMITLMAGSPPNFDKFGTYLFVDNIHPVADCNP